MQNKKLQLQFALCLNNKDYPASLEIRKVYQVLDDPLADSHQQIRIIDESGEDYLYPREYFLPVQLPKEAEAIFK